MSITRKIPQMLKRVLSKTGRALYASGKVNGNLELTEEGRVDFLNFLLTKHDKEYAREVVIPELKSSKKDEWEGEEDTTDEA